MSNPLHDGGAHGSQKRKSIQVGIDSLSPTQKAFADQIFNDVVNILQDDAAVLDVFRGRFYKGDAMEGFLSDLYAGIANYDTIRTGQLKYTQDELTRIISMMPGSANPTGRYDGIDYPPVDVCTNNAIPRGNFDTSIGNGCDECGNTHGDAHSLTCKRGVRA